PPGRPRRAPANKAGPHRPTQWSSSELLCDKLVAIMFPSPHVHIHDRYEFNQQVHDEVLSTQHPFYRLRRRSARQDHACASSINPERCSWIATCRLAATENLQIALVGIIIL